MQDRYLDLQHQYPSVDVLIAGDFKARTKDFIDYIINRDIYYIHGDVDYSSDKFNTSRNSRYCYRFNHYSRSLTEFCKANDMYIMNGCFSDDIMRNNTCISNGGKSIVNHCLSNKNVFDIVSYFAVGERDGSDYYPLLCTLSFLRNITSSVDRFMALTSYTLCKWKEQFSNDFMSAFQRHLSDSKEHIIDAIDINVDDAVSKAISLYQKSWQRYNKPYRHNINVQPTEWWDDVCESLKRFEI